LGEEWFAFARNLLLGVEYIAGNQFRWVELTARGATRKHQQQGKR
jgi:hypothetical protein